MLTRQEQLLTNSTVSVAAGNAPSNIYTSKAIPWGGEPGWILIVKTPTAMTGTTPSLTIELDLSDNGGAYTRVGGAIAAITAVGVTVIPYFTNSTQGAVVPSYNNTHTYSMQVKGTLAAADNVIPNVSIDLVAMD